VFHAPISRKAGKSSEPSIIERFLFATSYCAGLSVAFHGRTSGVR
jgi:hypothetical protein